MDTYNHFQYGKWLTERMRFFSGAPRGEKVFFTAPNSDSLFSISQKLSSINYPVLVAVNGYDADYEDNSADALQEQSQYFFMILQPAQSDDADDILAKQGECKVCALQVQARMMLDSRAYVPGLIDLLPNTFSIRSIGPIGDNLYGVIMGFNVRQNIQFFIKPEMWK